MGNCRRVAVLVAAASLCCFAGEVMKISYSGSMSTEQLSSLAKITFTDSTMNAGAVYSLNKISKIEFYNDGSSGIDSKINTQALKHGNIGFFFSGSTLKLQLSETNSYSVELFNFAGRNIAKLHSGTASVGILSLPVVNISSGTYLVMVKSPSAVYSQKIQIK